jgi:methylglutaconyl-CoA hydratase
MKPANESILIDVQSNGVATMTLNRPDFHNAFEPKMIQSIIKGLDTLSTNDKVRLLVLRSTGKSFCAGADLTWMQSSVNFSFHDNEQDAKQLYLMLHKLAQFNKPTIAVVQGAAYGGGIGLIACCHSAIISSEAIFCFSEVKLGIIPAMITPYIIKSIGERNTLAYFLSAKTFHAADALRMGLCQLIAEPKDLEKQASEWIHAHLQGAPIAQQTAIQFIENSDFRQSASLIASLRISEEGQEGFRAFFEKRKPKWMN